MIDRSLATDLRRAIGASWGVEEQQGINHCCRQRERGVSFPHLPPMPSMELPMLMLFDVLERGAVREPLTGIGSFCRRYGVRGMSQLCRD